MNFVPEKIEEYALAHTKPEPELLKKLCRETNAKIMFPRMLSGHLQGRFLSFISKIIHPKNILEIGAYTGYSCICLAEGLQRNGTIHTVEINEELEPLLHRYFKEAGITKKVRLHIGNALEIIPAIPLKFDLVFIDADKENYSAYYDLVFPKLKSGGVMIADNVLWSGKALEQPAHHDKDTKALVAFSKKIQDDTRIENLLLPLRDGLMMIRKKG